MESTKLESIEFAKFILDLDKNHFSVEELYEQFKLENYGNTK